MTNPIKYIKTHLKVKKAMNKASGLLHDPAYKDPSNIQKFIEMIDFRLGLRERLEKGGSALDGYDQEKAEYLLPRILEAVEQGKPEDAEKGLELLSQYFGYPQAARFGGVPEILFDVMLKHNKKEGDGVIIPESLMKKSRALFEKQECWSNHERQEKWESAAKTLHERYPHDFLNMLCRPGLPDWELARNEWC